MVDSNKERMEWLYMGIGIGIMIGFAIGLFISDWYEIYNYEMNLL
jgi:uncharacterized protein YneF (UPF0154 family)